MKVTVVGYWGGYPAKDGATSAYLVETNGFSLLIDIGSGALSKLQLFKNIDEIDAVIISHYHHDHIADLGVLQYAKRVHYYVTGQENTLPIYGHTEDQAAFQRLTSEYTKGIGYEIHRPLQIGPFTLTFLKTKHPVTCYGMRITDGKCTMVYTADTAFQEQWISFSRHADLLITDCNFFAGQNAKQAGHMTSEEGATIADLAQVKALLLSHLPQKGNLEQLRREASQIYPGTIYLAETGFVWTKE